MATNYFEVEDYSVGELFTKARPFHIPSFQRPYSWGEDECRKLWDDVENFFIKKEPYKHENDVTPPRYFLGSVVSYKAPLAGGKTRNAVIDGQQRITTLMLLLKVFYDNLNAHTNRDDPAQKEYTKILERIEETLWCVEWNDDKNENAFEIDKPILTSEAIEDLDSVGDFKRLMTSRDGDFANLKHSKANTRYIENYLVLRECLEKSFGDGGDLAQYANHKWRFVKVILDSCILLFINCKEEHAALKIFNTLNNRGMQLRDADILKSYLYDKYGNRTTDFKHEWATFSVLAQKAGPLKPDKTPAQDEIFRLLMMWSKASNNNSDNDIALREYFENGRPGSAEITDTVLNDKLIPLAGLFAAIAPQAKNVLERKIDDTDEDKDVDDNVVQSEVADSKTIDSTITAANELLTETCKKYMQVLACFNKNAYWRHLLAVFYLKHRGEKGLAASIEKFIAKVAAFNIVYVLYSVPFTQIRLKTYSLLCEIFSTGDFGISDILRWSKSEKPISLMAEDFGVRIDAVKVKAPFSRALTLLHAYLNPRQDGLIPLDAQVEHIFPVGWAESMTAAQRTKGIYGVTDDDMMDKIYECFGNKVMLEKTQNILASDGYFDLKACVYQGNYYGKKYTVKSQDNGVRIQQVDARGRVKKCVATEIADVKDVWKLPQWGKEQILARDKQVKDDLLTFFRRQLEA